MEKEILNKLEHWTEKEIDSILEHDGTPLWAYYKQMFLTNNFHNRYFNYSLKNLKERIEKKEKKSKKLISLVTRKAIVANEIIKRIIRKRHKKNTDFGPKVLFLTQADKVMEDKKVLKFGNLIEKTKEAGISSWVLSYEPIEKNTGKKLLKQDHMIYEYVDSILLKKVKEKTKELNKKWKTISKEKKWELLKINEDSIYPYLKDELNFLFSKEFIFMVLLYYEAYKKILVEENIKLVCAQGAGTIYPKALFSAANRLHIPSLIIQHGICFGYLEYDLLKDTVFSVFGQKSKEELLEKGFKENKIVITGASIFEETSNYIGLPTEEDKITIMTNGFYIYGLLSQEEYFGHIDRWLKQIRQELPQKKILLKLHPEEKEYIEKYQEIIKRYDDIEVTAKAGKEFLYSTMINSSIIINFASTVALEAMILDKPVITISDLHSSPILEFDLVIKRIMNSGASINVSKQDNMGEKIKEVLNNLKRLKELSIARKKFVQESCYKLDGKASERIVQVIKERINMKSIT